MMSVAATQASETKPGQTLKALIGDRHVSAQQLADHLDALSHDARVAALHTLSRSDQRALYDKVAGFKPIDLAYFVAESVAPLTPVRHHGWNSLPAFRLFEKRFYRYGSGEEIAGANFQTLSPVTGPGYFCCRLDESAREVLIDYNLSPSTAPGGWPAITPNTRFPSALVYGRMIDRMRYVSRHVSIGSATRNGKALGSWFTLCRSDAP
jgi:hypothetical protein